VPRIRKVAAQAPEINKSMTASNPAGQVSDAVFKALVKRWKKDTEADSSILRMIQHPAYQEIIALGDPAIPLLLEELKREPDFWFAALRQITGANSALPESAGKVKEMTRAWIKWGKEKGYIE
jgi:hypothetical protein